MSHIPANCINFLYNTFLFPINLKVVKMVIDCLCQRLDRNLDSASVLFISSFTKYFAKYLAVLNNDTTVIDNYILSKNCYMIFT